MADTKQSKPLASKSLTPAQAKHIALLVAQIHSAQIALDAAQRNADNFLVYCAEENSVPLGVDGWAFVQSELRFVQMPQAHTNGTGPVTATERNEG